MKNLKKNLDLLISNSKKQNKKTAIFIGNTKKKNKNLFYNSGIRVHKKFNYLSIIVFSNSISKKIIKLIDGRADIIFYDLEKKVSYYDKINAFNLERIVKENVKFSQIYPYKANDLTLNSAETLISNFFKKELTGVGGKKSLIIGAGNVGFKLALKLNESGSNTYLFRRDKIKLRNIVNTLNIVKPDGTISKSHVSKNLEKDIFEADIIINCSDNKGVLKKKHIKFIKSNCFLLDIGKGMFEKEALKILMEKKINIFRLDVTPGYNAFIENFLISNQIYDIKKFGRNKINGKSYVSRGILGFENDIVTDNPFNPKKIFGIADGYGDLKKKK